MSAPTVSDALRILAGKGLVERGQAPDARAWTAPTRGSEVARHLQRWRDPLLAALRDQPATRKASALSSMLGVIAELNGGGHISTARTCLTCRFFRGDPGERRLVHAAGHLKSVFEKPPSRCSAGGCTPRNT